MKHAIFYYSHLEINKLWSFIIYLKKEIQLRENLNHIHLNTILIQLIVVQTIHCAQGLILLLSL
jgi:hypothetical protein